MGNKLKVAALAIAGACLSVLTYIMGYDDCKKSNAAKLTLNVGNDNDIEDEDDSEEWEVKTF